MVQVSIRGLQGLGFSILRFSGGWRGGGMEGWRVKRWGVEGWRGGKPHPQPFRHAGDVRSRGHAACDAPATPNRG